MFDTLRLFPARRPRLALLLLLGVTIALSCFLPRLRIDSSMDTIFLQNAERTVYGAFKETFGEDEIIIVGLRTSTGDVFNTATLEKIERITKAIEALPEEHGVARVVSLSNVEDIRGLDGMLDVDDLIPQIPTDAAALARIRKQTYENPLFLHNLVSEDGAATAITVELVNRPEEQSFKERLVLAIREIVEPERGPEEFHFAGIPVLTQYTSDFLLRDMAVLIPVTLAIIVLTLWLSFRTVVGVLLPLATVGVSVLWMLGFTGMTGKSISLLSSIVPSLLIAMGSAYAIHVASEFHQQRLSDDSDGEDPVEATLRHAFLPVLLAGLTTSIGFLALTSSDVLLIRDFGAIAAFGIASSTVMTLIGVPAGLRIVQPPDEWTARTEPLLRRTLLRGLDRMAAFDARHPKLIIALSLVCVALGCWGAAQIRVDTDYASNFKPDAEPVQALRFMREHLSGERPIVVLIEARDGRSTLDPAILARIDEVGDILRSHDKVGSALSIADYLKRMNQAMNDGDPARFALPDSLELASQYLLLFSRPEETGRFLSFDETSAAVIGRSSIISSEEFLVFMDTIRRETSARFGDELKITITGSMYLLSRASIAIAIGQAKSLGLASLLIFLVMFVLFRSIKFGLLAMLPNLLPILANFALMGALGVTLNTGTSVMAAMALGIAVDDTIHVLVRYRTLRATLSGVEAVRETLRTAGLAIATTSLTNLLGFLALTLSSFAPLVALGWLTATTMATALLADLVLLPALLLVFDRDPVTT